MGEIGFNRDTFLYIVKWWEIRAIIEGYRRRERTYCMMTRWATYMQMSSGMADLKKAGIYSPEDLMKLPWDSETHRVDDLTDEEIEAERKRLQEENNKNNV